jgi:hypothetical protein
MSRAEAGRKTGLANLRHGDTRHGRTPEYYAWVSMIRRCHAPRARNYRLYGARGITVCQRWRESFPTFLGDVGRKPSPDLSLDRIDNNGNYEPGNVRWATRSEQQRNKRPFQWRHRMLEVTA